MSIDTKELLEKSIQYSAKDRLSDFEKEHNASLLKVDSVNDINFNGTKNVVVLHVVGGGSIPFKVGVYTLVQERTGSYISVGVYTRDTYTPKPIYKNYR